MATKKKTKRTRKATKVTKAVPAPVVKAAPKPKVVPIDLAAFRRTSGIRPEHFGGFERYITLVYGPGDRLYKSPAEWRSTYDQYLKRPVIG
ncbi:MAG: hypothetical protein CME17_00975 [Gemmatimonadetes bacterium]|nr:hypothetical protein [Gemmatimonadota bacterium]